MNIGLIGRLALSLAVCAMAACTANQKSIFRYQLASAEAPSYALIDAKQRAIIATPRPVTPKRDGDQTATPNDFVVCAEPSPDVFSVIAQAASGTGRLGKSADPKSLELAASFAASSSEQGSTLARTQTMNMLRELMYRTCERYLNKGIGELELPIQAIRDQRLMVGVLAIEQLTSAATPRVVTLGATGASAAGASTQDAVVKIDAAHETLLSTQKDVTAKQEAVTKSKDDCAAIDAKVASKTTLTADETKKQQECAAAQSALAKAQTAAKDASDHYAALKKVSDQGGGGPASATTTISPAVSAEGQVAQAAALEKVAATVKDIVQMTQGQDELLMVCLKKIQISAEAHKSAKPEDAKNAAVTDVCTSYINTIIATAQAKADRETQVAKAEAADANVQRLQADALAFRYEQDVATARQAIAKVKAGKFDRFWAKVVAADGKSADADALGALIDGYIAKKKPAKADLLRQMKALSTRDPLYALFAKLPTQTQTDLAQ